MAAGRIAILGAGNGGFAATVDLTLRGHVTTLWNRGEAALEPLRSGGRIWYEGVLGSGHVTAPPLTTDLREATAGADVILVCLPAHAHAELARSLARHLADGAIVVLDPGGLLGSLAFARELRRGGFGGALHIGETSTLTYIARKTSPAGVAITHVARDLPFAALPGDESQILAAGLDGVLPNLRVGRDILEVGLASINTVLHPPAMVLAAAWIEHTGGDFYYYFDAATPSVARLMSRLDAERLAVARAWTRDAEPFLDVFAAIGSTTPEAAASGDFRRALLESRPNRWIKAPESLDHRYMREDIPCGVVPLAELGRVAGVATPVLDAIVTICSTSAGIDFRETGRNAEALGIAGRSMETVLDVLLHGRP